MSGRLIDSDKLLTWLRVEQRRLGAERHSPQWHVGANEAIERLMDAILDEEV